MVRAPFALLALALLLPAGPAAAQGRDQVAARVRAEFTAADRNRDGFLNRGEVTQRIVRVFGGRGMTTGRSRILTNHYFQRLDQDRDGRITRAEATRAAADGLRRFDTNRDGRIGPRERAAADAFLRNPGR